MHDVFLGYGDPGASTASKEQARTINFNDTFLTADHLRASFPTRTFEYQLEDHKGVRKVDAGDKALVPPFKVNDRAHHWRAIAHPFARNVILGARTTKRFARNGTAECSKCDTLGVQRATKHAINYLLEM